MSSSGRELDAYLRRKESEKEMLEKYRKEKEEFNQKEKGAPSEAPVEK